MSNPQDNYSSYLLRLRRVQSDNGRTWVASLQSTTTNNEQWFVDIKALVEFLQSEFGVCDQVTDAARSNERSDAIP